MTITRYSFVCRLISVSLRGRPLFFTHRRPPHRESRFPLPFECPGSFDFTFPCLMVQLEASSGRRPSSPIPRPSVLHTGRIPSRDHRPNARRSRSRSPRSRRLRANFRRGASRESRRGEPQTATRRRPGDRSCGTEVRAEREDKRTERGTRRTAGDDSIERFKRGGLINNGGCFETEDKSLRDCTEEAETRVEGRNRLQLTARRSHDDGHWQFGISGCAIMSRLKMTPSIEIRSTKSHKEPFEGRAVGGGRAPRQPGEDRCKLDQVIRNIGCFSALGNGIGGLGALASQTWKCAWAIARLR
jgi:hypothetical protein